MRFWMSLRLRVRGSFGVEVEIQIPTRKVE